jgi:hypothetical protein
MKYHAQNERFAFAGPFHQDDVEPTCEGIGYVLEESQNLGRDQFLQVSMEVMDAIWKQLPPREKMEQPNVSTSASLISAIKKGWRFNANEADFMLMVFGKIVPVAREGRIVGIGSVAPDGAVIQDGRELVFWRDRKWMSLERLPPQKPQLAIVQRA